ncbi:LOW QUALITY PROTEIN: kynureninase [Bacillus sp. JCM 19047]|nr:LOW QUALITY PROTEIN: kynureninase [Bacillus sp. JCM 19047]
MDTSKQYAAKLDATDRLAPYQKEFYLDKNTIYMDGNSLGLLSKRAEQAVLQMLEDWKTYGIDGWTDGQYPGFTLSEKLGASMAPLVGASTEEVLAMGSTTVNLHQLLATFYQPTADRYVIVSEALSFPTDLYAIHSHLDLHSISHEKGLRLIESKDGHTLSEEDIIASFDDDVAVVVLSSVLYRSGQLLSLERLTKAAHDKGILIGFDLCHSIGSVPHQLKQWNVDFAFWCTYKHLNGGPGSVGGLFVHEKHHTTLPGLRGWFGSDKSKQFDMSPLFHKSAAVGSYQLGTPHLLSMAPLIGSLDMFTDVGIEAIRTKSLALTHYLRNLLHQLPDTQSFTISTPVHDEERGGHLLLEHPEAARICKALKSEGIIPDFRSPNGVRIAPVALYNSFTDVYETAHTLATIMKKKTYLQFENKRGVIA